MIFEEDFQGLKDKAHFVTEFKIGEIPEEEIMTDKGKVINKLSGEPHSFEGKSVNLVGDSYRVYNEEDIQKHCLDKQKVLDDIDGWLKIDYDNSDKTQILKALKKQMGLI